MRIPKKKSATLEDSSEEELATMAKGPAKKIEDPPPPPLEPNDESRLALLPWLAKGFCPIQTSAQDYMCGIYALCTAFQSAREYLKEPGETIVHLTSDDFSELFHGDEYTVMAEEVVRVQKDIGFAAEDSTELEDMLSQKSNLDIVGVFRLKYSLFMHLTISRCK